MTFSSCYRILFEFDQRQKQNKEQPSHPSIHPDRQTDRHPPTDFPAHLPLESLIGVGKSPPCQNQELNIFISSELKHLCARSPLTEVSGL